MKLSIPFITILLFILVPRPVSCQLPEDFTGHWEGAIEIPGSPLVCLIDLKRESEVWTGTIDIPAQSARGLILGGITVNGNEIVFAIAGVPGDPTFTGVLREGKITGEFTQSGLKFSFSFGREKAEGPERPQEPQPPFPYIEEEVTCTNEDITLAGTLTLPKEGGPFPAVLLISGSGAQNRDSELFGHKPFLLIADFLTRAGIAVLRVDDRGVGGSSAGSIGATSADFVEDVLAGVNFLKEDSRLDPQKIGLIGHSEGGAIAPMAATSSNDIAFVIMMAGPGVSGKEILLEQTKLISRTAGATQQQLEDQWDAQDGALTLAASGADSVLVWESVKELIEVQYARLPEDQRPSEDILINQTTVESRRVLSPWFRYFLNFDLRTVLKRMKTPVLVLNGSLDLQVPPYQSLPEIEKALQEAGNDDVTIREFPGLNHLFQSAVTGSPAEYGAITETISPEVLEMIRDWILERFGPGSPLIIDTVITSWRVNIR